MQIKVYKIKARNMNSAVKEAERLLDTSSDNIKIEIIEEPKKLFGISIGPLTIKAALKDTPQKEEESKDASFSFDYRESGVFLVIAYSMGNGKKICEDDILNKAIRKNIKDLDAAKIAEALSSKTEEILIAPYQEEERVDENAEITLSNDTMEAFIAFIPPEGGAELTLEDISLLIEQKGIVYGIDAKLIENLASNKRYYEKIKFASGKQSENGKDGVIEYKIDFRQSTKPKYLDDGSVNYYERENNNSVKAGDIIAVYIKPTEGVNGCNVKGQEISAKDGKDLALPLGHNVTLNDEGTEILSSIDGAVEIKNNKINVTNLLLIDGNLDLSVGNINFAGNVKITGNVMSCLSITADGSVEVMGTVEGASITAKGDIRLKRGISGAGKGTLKADGNIYAGFIENSTVFSRKNVYASSIIHSEVDSFDSIIVSGGKGIIYGGSLKATNKISSQSIGSTANAATVLEIGIPPSVRSEYDEMLKSINKVSDELKYISNVIDLAGGNLNQRQDAIKTKLSAERLRKKYLLEGYKKKLAELNEIMKNDNSSSINVLDTIYPGAKITINTLTYIVNDQIKYSTFKILNDEIVILPYSVK